ncbi:peroxiredoxin-like family protein [Flammeovirga sp. EKP202]|uniref:peroxiredoxin-like family protein n=1 Tax=Flammeovirga sp. EKP202 TaxID=2770592 RepID=UPI00165FCE58|nr:peroxiredoxin-like family protein [Flammeovirga sp. EKP202]MBD0400679.1 AhpC/TSA family protein [Flammeovirga sp. EKP202]
MELQESLSRLKEKIEGGMPPEFVEIMHQSTRDLEASGIGEKTLKAGDKAPSFSLPNHKGEIVSSDELLKQGPLVITFYRGVWCPYCNTDLAFLKRYKAQFDEMGVSMVSISPQTIENNKKIIDQQRLNFDLLRDAENNIAAQFGLRWEMVDPLKSLYNDKFNIKLNEYNGDDSWTLPVPARFIIDTDGIIKYAEYSVDYTKRPNPDVLVSELQAV